MNIPNAFLPNTKIKSEEINSNFSACKTAIETNSMNINTASKDLAEFKATIEPQVMSDFKHEAINGEFAIASDKNKIKLIAGTTIRLNIGTDDIRYLKIDTDTEYNMNNILDTGIGSLIGGKDYYGYLVAKDVIDEETEITTKVTDVIISLNSTYPTGYTAANSRKIFGFHTLCLAVTFENAPEQLDGIQHPAMGYNAGDIIPISVWCLSHRPQSEPNGMAYIAPIDKWVDIYWQGGKDGNPTSVFGATVVDSRQQPNHQWDMQVVNKLLATDNDFTMFAEGSNQKTAISGSVSPIPKTAGGHVDTSGKRMISKFFIEECCGYLWQWLDENSANGGSGFSTYDGKGSRGQTFGASYCLIAGGGWSSASSCGSRSRGAATPRSYVDTNISGRGVSLPLRV